MSLQRALPRFIYRTYSDVLGKVQFTAVYRTCMMSLTKHQTQVQHALAGKGLKMHYTAVDTDGFLCHHG